MLILSQFGPFFKYLSLSHSLMNHPHLPEEVNFTHYLLVQVFGVISS